MKSLTIRQFDEKKEEIAEVLISFGINRTAARALSYLQGSNEVTSVELEREAGLRQPEISIVMRDLKERGWISEREEKKPGKGRPYKVYLLKISFNQIIAELEKQQKRAADEARLRIERLRKSRKY